MTGELAAWVGDGIAGTAVIGNVTMSIIQSRRRNRNAWLRLLEDAGGVSVEQVERAFDTRPAAAELFGTAMDAATRTQQRAQHQMLAGIVHGQIQRTPSRTGVPELLTHRVPGTLGPQAAGAPPRPGREARIWPLAPGRSLKTKPSWTHTSAP
jgi:hypothetical protein